jgi:Eukaryotic protein of unknown function (DUF866)
MVLLMLHMKADLENVASVKLLRDVNLCISVKNPLSDYETREKVTVNPSETVEQEDNSREPPHHFRLTWDGAKKAGTLTVLDDAGAKAALKKKKGAEVPREYNADDSGNFVPILLVECRGLEPYSFHPMGNDFVVTNAGGAEFSDEVDFSEGDWADYDADNDQSVSVSAIEFKWESV